MIILSSFNSEYLKGPLQYLIDVFVNSEEIEIRYGNVRTLLSDLENVEGNSSVSVLFRLIDLVSYDGKTIDVQQLQSNLQSLIDTIDVMKKKLAVHFMVVLCPSLECNLPSLQFVEKRFYETMQSDSFALIKVSDIQAYYSLVEIENKVGKEIHIPYTPRFYSALACFLARKLYNLIRKPHKVIVVDCDDTLWNGIAGDVSVENITFAEHNRLLQKFLADKCEEGWLICLCCRNDQQNILDVFSKRCNDMPLKLDHVCKIKINWQLKYKNIIALVEELNLDIDTFIFIDDSPFEIENVRRNIPAVCSIKAPQNVKEFAIMKDNWAFDGSFVTDEDKIRTRAYKEDEKRINYQSSFSNYIEFLQSINLSVLIEEVKETQDEAIKRISTLSRRTNQFNLFTQAKHIAEIKNSLKAGSVIFSVNASDDFGDFGLIAVAFCHSEKNAFCIDSYFLSCRAFNKGIEYRLIKHIAQYAVDKLLDSVNLRFKRTEKNVPGQRFVTLLLKNFSDDSSVDISQLAIGKEINISFSSSQLAGLDVNTLVEKQNALAKPIVSNTRKNTAVNRVKKSYLLKLQRMTQTLNFIYDNFFFNEANLSKLSTLESKIVMLCNFLLGDVKKDMALIYLGLDSLKAAELSYYLYQIAGVNISITVLLSDTMTIKALVNYLEQQKSSNDETSSSVPSKLAC